MSCPHSNTVISNSRTPENRENHGYRKLPYDCLKVRTRTCKDCKERFLTVEMRLDVMEQFNPVGIRNSVYARIHKFLDEDAQWKP